MLNYEKDRIKYPVIYDNKYGITDFAKWEKLEFDITQQRVYELQMNPSLVKRTFDSNHLFSIHKHIFQDCYGWAGQMRDNGGRSGWSKTRRIDGKAYTSFYTPDTFLPDRLNEIGSTVKKWTKQDGKYAKDDMLSLLGNVSDTINEIHLFREGNSRSKREFLRELADTNGYDLDFGKISVKDLTNGEFIANSDFCNGADVSKTKNERVQILKDLYSPILSEKGQMNIESASLQAYKAKCPKNFKAFGTGKQNVMDNVEE